MSRFWGRVSKGAPAFVALLTMLGSAAAPVQAGWTLLPTPRALVAEQIFPVNPASFPVAYGLDYEFRVLDTGAVPITGFALFTGTQPNPLQVVLPPNPPHIPPPGYGWAFGPVGNPIVPFLTAEGNTFSPVPWQFSEYDNRPNPITGYDVEWTFTGGRPLPSGRWTQFDLFSTNGPVAGGGAVDPAGPSGIDVYFGDGTMEQALFTSTVPVGTSEDTSDPFGGTSSPYGGTYPGPEYSPGGFSSVPEPGSAVLLGMGSLGLLGTARRWRRRLSG